MTARLEVAFKLLDQVSPVVRDIDRSLVGTVRSLRHVDQALKKVGRAELRQSVAAQTDPLKKYRAALMLVRDELRDAEGSSFGGKLAALGSAAAGPWGMVAAAVTAATAALTAGTVAVGGFAIKWASFKRDSLMALELIMGSAQAASVTYERLSKLADKTPFPTEDIIDFGKELLSAQFTLKETEDILAAVADAASVQGAHGGEAARSLLSGIAKIKGRDALNMETIEQVITGGGAAGVNLGNLLETLARERGTSVEAVRQAIGAGQVKGVEGVRAILATVERVTDKGGPLGTATQLFGTRSLSGQLSTLQSRVRALFKDIDIGPLVDVFRRVNELLSAHSPTGKLLHTFVNDLFGRAFKSLGSLFSEENLKAVLDQTGKALVFLKDTFDGMARVVSAFFDGLLGGFEAVPGTANPVLVVLEHLRELVTGQSAADWRLFGEAIGAVVKALALFARAALQVERAIATALRPLGIGELVDRIRAPSGGPAATGANAARGPVVTSLASLGAAASDAFRAGLLGAAGGTFAAGARLGTAAATGVRTALDIHSPSRVMQHAGRMTGEGFELGLRESDADRELASLLAQDTPRSVAERPAARRGTVHVTIGDIVVQAGAAPTESPRDLAQAIRRELMLALEDFALTT